MRFIMLRCTTLHYQIRSLILIAIMNSINIIVLQKDLTTLIRLYVSTHNMIEHPVGADLVQLAEISNMMTKIRIISGQPPQPFNILQLSFSKPALSKSALSKTISTIREKLNLNR